MYKYIDQVKYATVGDALGCTIMSKFLVVRWRLLELCCACMLPKFDLKSHFENATLSMEAFCTRF